MEREKVINWLEDAQVLLAKAVDRGGEMAVMSAFNCHNNVTRAIAFLKEQEAVEPKKESDDYPGSWWYVCGNCGGVIDWHDMYCRHCGQAVKWK